MEIDIFDTKQVYDVIYSDPPWAQKKGNKRKCRPNQEKELDYNTMSMEDIKRVHEQVSNLTNEKHNIFMWTIEKFLEPTKQMMKELGYEMHCCFVWDKENGVAPAFTVRFTHEYLLWFYKKGSMLMPDKEVRGKFTTILREASTGHSKKPEYAYRMIEAMFPESRKLEMFARSTRDGWDAWGNQVGLLDTSDDLYTLRVTVSKIGKEDVVSTYTAATIEEVKDQVVLGKVIKRAVEIFDEKGDMRVEYFIENKDGYVDSDECDIYVHGNQFRIVC